MQSCTLFEPNQSLKITAPGPLLPGSPAPGASTGVATAKATSPAEEQFVEPD